MPPEDEELVTEEEELPPAGHPAWQEILNVLPEEFHSLITPKLQEWDTGVQANQQKLHSEYEVYKPLLDNGVPLENIQQALYMAQMLENEPETLVDKAIEHYKLEKYMNINNDTGTNDGDDDDDFDDDEIDMDRLRKNPAFKEFFEQQAQLVEWQQNQQADKEQDDAVNYMQEYLTELHTTHGEFDELVVTALMANGFDGADAVEQFQSAVNQAAANAAPGATKVTPPVVMGGSGTTGSGVPDATVDFGTLGKNDLNDLVAQYINAAND